MNPATRDDLVKEFAAGVVYELLDAGVEYLTVSEYVDEHYESDTALYDEVYDEVQNILAYLDGQLDKYYN